MAMSHPCARCNALTETILVRDRLWLCPRCPLAPTPCPPHGHDWHGSQRIGIWVCHECGETKGSQEISTDPVFAEYAPYMEPQDQG